ncbi:glycine zipper 2TM domain-containing protein [Halobacterium sp. CBA1126]|uniref:glycine zipper 2TM domain-containing protein n=1 Tax=Halobacterium TaxID=2239 RepID=UPI0012F79260|nr:glycine zipper 2TM domain-containing protein [Halobacterium sp. CBA1126]MUV61281.1 glycine zipper 2TM domain-containing protein [Halobacterium sp. CBA1126]
MSRLKRVFSRAKYAAIGAAVGGALGGLLSRNAASTAAGVGGLVGAIVGEKRVDVGTLVDGVKDRKPEADVVSRSEN